MILSEAQIRELTGRKRCDAQKRQLVQLGIPFKERTDGSLVVYSVHAYPTAPAMYEPEPVLHL